MPKNKVQMRCDNCGTLNKLSFDPRKYWDKLRKFKCNYCRRLVYNEQERQRITSTESILSSSNELRTSRIKSISKRIH